MWKTAAAMANRTTAKTHRGRYRSRWRLNRLLHATWQDLKHQLGSVSAPVWLRWTGGLIGGFALCSLLMYVITQTARHWNALSDYDHQALRWLIDHAPMAFADAIMYESPGNLIYLGPLALVAALWLIRRDQALAGISLVTGYLLQRPLVLLGWLWWDRMRPDMVGGGIAAPGFNAFPSGHTALSGFVYGFLAYLWIRSSSNRLEQAFAVVVTVAWVTLIAVGRLRLGAHWPSDMVGGALIALPWLGVMILLHSYLEAHRHG